MMLEMRLSRRSTLTTAAAIGATAAAVRIAAPGGDDEGALGPAALQPVRLVELPLAGELLADVLGRVTGVLDIGSFRQLALVWEGEPDATFEVRTRHEGRWSGWQKLHGTEHRAAEEGNGRLGTDLIWVGEADRAQVRVRGAAPRRLHLVAVDPGWAPADENDLALAAYQRAPRPEILTRSAWNADESWRDGDPYYYSRARAVHVHHTASSNDYSRADVPAMLRGMYRYHTHTLGWSDIGYNFLVDKFGRLWEGRAGGVRKVVRGAHTLGFNHYSVGVAMIGNFETAQPSDNAVTAVVKLAAWKLDHYGYDPNSYVWFESTGSDRYPAGTRVRLHRIDGHRDTNQTACPGRNLYARLPEIRRRAQARDNLFQPAVTTAEG